jgi:hypothetical protein
VRVGSEVGVKVEFRLGRLASSNDICGQGIVIKAVDEFHNVSYYSYKELIARQIHKSGT